MDITLPLLGIELACPGDWASARDYGDPWSYWDRLLYQSCGLTVFYGRVV